MKAKLQCQIVSVLLGFNTAAPAALLDGFKERAKESGAFDLAADPLAQAAKFVKSSKLDYLKGLKRVAITSFQIEIAIEISAADYTRVVDANMKGLQAMFWSVARGAF